MPQISVQTQLLPILESLIDYTLFISIFGKKLDTFGLTEALHSFIYSYLSEW